MMKTSYEKLPAYFAASNSFDGFKSNFDKIFIPEKFTRIYILKGGPGTGKSTLMKQISKFFHDKGIDVIKLFCSSDPQSLDGIILSNQQIKIALLDGTAPHSFDCSYPGAVETIINLADALNQKELNRRKKEIINLSQKKKAAYARAYGILKTAGSIYDCIWDEIRNTDVNNEAEWLSRQVMQYELFNEKHSEIIDEYLVCAFCKDGYYRLDIPCFEKEYISLKGDGFTEQIVINVLLKHLCDEVAVSALSRSPLTTKNIDLIVTGSCIISTDNTGCTVIDTSSLAKFFGDEYKNLYLSYKNMLTLSQSYFKKASEFHFKLEDIYTENIDFSLNENVRKKLVGEISDLIL